MEDRNSVIIHRQGIVVWLTLAAFGVMGLFPVVAVAQAMDLSFLTTRAEATDYQETTRYDEAIGFLEVAAAQSSDLHLTTFGYTGEGRALPLVIWGTDHPDSGAILEDGRTRIFIQANIHGGEVCGKEAMLALIRDLAAGRYDHWKDSVILLIAPIYNADGNERVSLYNRPRQYGPVGGMGQRPNAADLDLNRDHMKLASPEARSLVQVMSTYDPEVLVDLHTTNGTRHGYHLTYSPPLNPNTAPSIDGLLRNEVLPKITSVIKEKYGWDFYYYGNLPFRGDEPGWYTFDHRPRFNNNYVGLRNRVAILSEAYSYASFKERVLASRAFVEEVITYVVTHPGDIRDAISEAEAVDLVGLPFAVRAEHKRSEAPVDILMGGANQERNPYSGAPMLVRTDESRVEAMYEYGTFQATETVLLPQAYIIPPGLRGVSDMLDDHGITYSRVEGQRSLMVEEFRIDSTNVAGREFQGVKERTLFGQYLSTQKTVEAGALWVPVAQPLGRLLAYLVEARSDDGLVTWGKLEAALSTAATYPILRVPATDRP
ncbi:MAG: hypothetical protein ACI9BV_001023 [Rhodothermales bacterium]|jgi:hypothetical protein